MNSHTLHIPLAVAIPLDFQPLDRNAVVIQYRRKLPHFRQEGATYFVTFRLADSVPEEIAQEMRQAEEIWARRLQEAKSVSTSLKDEYEDQRRARAIRLENLLDAGAGACWMRTGEFRDQVCSTLLHFHELRFTMYSFVVMPNHVHALLRPLPGHDLESIIGTWKQHSALILNRMIGQSGTFWQAETWDRIVRDSDHFRRVARYIARNPIRAGLNHKEASVWSNPVLQPPTEGNRVEEELAPYGSDPW